MRRTAYFAFLLLSALGSAATQPPARPHSSADSLRIQLQTVLNDAELAIRNRNSMKQSLERQSRDIGYLKVFERIPFDDRRQQLREELTQSAEEFGVTLVELRYASPRARDLKIPKIPKALYTDDPPFQPDPGALVRELGMTIDARGESAKIEAWMKSWPEAVLRWVEPLRAPRPSGVAGRWKIDARAYTFLKLPAPAVRIRDPRELLPLGFQADPSLSSLVARIEKIRPEAEPFLKGRGDMLLDRARLEFFLRKSLGSS